MTLAFAPPGWGTWQQDRAHNPKPMSRLALSLAAESFGAGFIESMSLYGVPIRSVTFGDVHGYPYLRIQFAGDAGPDGPPCVVTMAYGRPQRYEEVRETVAENFGELARYAAGRGVVVALEPHVGQAFDLPEKVLWLLERVGSPGVHPEGQFFPDTYRFASGTADLEILRQAHAQMKRRLEAAWRERDPQLPLASDYEALILASIVEKESALAVERARIAGVFVRRLRKGMRLQTDPTVIYGLGETYDGNIRSRDLRADTPYNTYTRAGLPPTPIAMPGEGALRAAVQPDDRGALYFVATGEPDGSHYFSATLEEHNAAVRRFLARMRAPRTRTGS